MVLPYLFAVLAACANATASVLQRKANRAEPVEENLSWRLIRDLLHQPTWFGGIVAVIAGFLLQAAALSAAQLAVIEPILVVELPITLLLAARVFRQRLGPREWGAAVSMTAALAGLLWFLSPRAGKSSHIGWPVWVVGIAVTIGIILAVVAIARRRSGPARAALLGIATGVSFGLTAALMKGMTDRFSAGIVALLTSWQLYAMIAAGAGAMFLLQSAMNAGRLLAAQPGITLADPVVSIVWGVAAFQETTRTGIWIILAVLAGALLVFSVIVLSRSPLLADDDADHEAGEDTERAADTPSSAADPPPAPRPAPSAGGAHPAR